MPKVGKMKFPYTGQGMKEAANYAKNSGKAIEIEGNYRGGGYVPKYHGGGRVSPMRPRPSMRPRRSMGLGRPMGPRRPMIPSYERGGKVSTGNIIRNLAKMGLINKLAGFKKGGKVKKK